MIYKSFISASMLCALKEFDFSSLGFGFLGLPRILPAIPTFALKRSFMSLFRFL